MEKFSKAFSIHHRLRRHISRFLNNVLKAEELGFPLVSTAFLSAFNITYPRLSLFIHGRSIVGFSPSTDCVRVVPGQTALVVCRMLWWDPTAETFGLWCDVSFALWNVEGFWYDWTAFCTLLLCSGHVSDKYMSNNNLLGTGHPKQLK